MYKELTYTGEDKNNNWLFSGHAQKGHLRYPTFQLALNLLSQRHPEPVIIETGCQREPDDYGAGMSTTIFAEYTARYGGHLISVDNSFEHLRRAGQFIAKIPNCKVYLAESDSVAYLEQYTGKCDLLYLDSYDYPYGEMLDAYGGKTDIDAAIKLVSALSHEQVMTQFGEQVEACQKHCLREFQAIEGKLASNVILMIDDNDFPGGGKPGLLKEYLLEKGWVCLYDYTQTLWVKEL